MPPGVPLLLWPECASFLIRGRRFPCGAISKDTRAEDGGYELLITTDSNLRYQQNLKSRSIAILVLTTTSWPRIREVASEINAAVGAITAGAYQEFSVPR